METAIVVFIFCLIGCGIHSWRLGRRDGIEGTVQYLIDQGIKADRLTYKGFGESQPIASNDNANGRQKNRRVAFKVIDETEE